MLTVGVDSYVTLEEADALVSSYFVSTDEYRTSWDALSTDDKEVLLRSSCKAINNLSFDGRRAKYGQKMEFPRVAYMAAGVVYTLFVSQYVDNGLYSQSVSSGLEEVKQAQVVNSVYANKLSRTKNELIMNRVQGLTSERVGPISRTYGVHGSDAEYAQIGIYTKEVFSLLKPWLNDSRIAI